MPSDEDGVVLPAVLGPGWTASIDVHGGIQGGILDAWIDFNGNGIFDHPVEHLWLGTSQMVMPGWNPSLPFTVLPTAVAGPTYARFRLSMIGGLLPTGILPTGAVPEGEVEDYLVEIEVPPGVIIVEKQTTPDGSVQSFEFSSSYGPNFMMVDDGTNNSGPLTAGTYAVSEVNLPASWSLTSATCDDGSDPSAIGLNPGETVTCTFANAEAQGVIIIEKQTDPDGSTQRFEFSTTFSSNFVRFDDGTYNSGPLLAGTYSVSEVNLPAGWSLTSATCDDGSDSGDIDLDPGETVTCVFTNTQMPGTIIVEKQTDPDGASDVFTFTGDVAGDITSGSQIVVANLSPGVYNTQETVPYGWRLASVECDDWNSGGGIFSATAWFGLEAGETITCIFQNALVDTDGDRIWDIDEGSQTDDRDGDGVVSYQDYDPSGYLYDEATGEIIAGGSVLISGPGVLTVIEDGSTGRYQRVHDGTVGDYIMTVNLPPGFTASETCLDLGVLNPGATPDPLNLGAGENGSTGYLTDWSCGTNTFYLVLRVDATNPDNIINNSIPLAVAQSAPFPSVNEWGFVVMVLLLFFAGTLILRRKAGHTYRLHSGWTCWSPRISLWRALKDPPAVD